MLFRIGLIVLVGCGTTPGAQSLAVVFGEDDRVEPHQADEPFARIAREQVAVRIVDWAVNFDDPSTPRITYTRTLGESLDLCEGERFADQIAPGSCSATLIDRQHILTAGHCVPGPEQCTDSHYWVFGFHMDESGELAELAADDVYQCARVVVADARADYSILELDREVRRRVPVAVRLQAGGLTLGTPVVIAGFPDGVPVKVDAGGAVVFSFMDRYFRATVDAFDVSSGSGVFDLDGNLVGVLQRGYPDYVPRGDCNVVNVFEATGDEGEVVGYPDAALVAYCAEEPASPLCACDGPCWDPADSDAGVPDTGLPAPDAGAPDASFDAGMSDASMSEPSAAGCAASGTSSVWLVFLLFRRRTSRTDGAS